MRNEVAFVRLQTGIYSAFVCMTSPHQNWEVMNGMELNVVWRLHITNSSSHPPWLWETLWRFGQDDLLLGVPHPIIFLTICMIYSHYQGWSNPANLTRYRYFYWKCAKLFKFFIIRTFRTGIFLQKSIYQKTNYWEPPIRDEQLQPRFLII